MKKIGLAILAALYSISHAACNDRDELLFSCTMQDTDKQLELCLLPKAGKVAYRYGQDLAHPEVSFTTDDMYYNAIANRHWASMVYAMPQGNTLYALVFGWQTEYEESNPLESESEEVLESSLEEDVPVANYNQLQIHSKNMPVEILNCNTDSIHDHLDILLHDDSPIAIGGSDVDDWDITGIIPE